MNPVGKNITVEELQQDGRGSSIIKTVRGVLHPAFQMAVDDDELHKNPFSFELATVIFNDSVTREAITKDQMRKFLKFVHDDNVYCKYYKGAFHERLNSYGMVIMDECHHAASTMAQRILKKVNAKYVYGVSATPMRSDNLEKINYMLLGPIRHRYTAMERTVEQGVDHFVIPRYTRLINTADDKENIHVAYALVSNSKVRNQQILEDIRKCVEQGRTPVILTRYKEHAKFLYDNIRENAEYVFLLYGDNSAKENEEIRMQLKQVPDDKSLILVGTGQKIGEGFDYPRLDTLILAVPVSFEGRLEQYVGRLNRDYDGKKDVIVYDYIDSHIQKFDNMYLKRLRTYKIIGFCVLTDTVQGKQDVNAVYGSSNYTAIFEQDIIEAEKEVVIASPQIIPEKTRRFIYLMKPRQETRIKITVITQNPENISYGNPAFVYELIRQIQEVRIDVKLTNDIEHFAVIDQLLVWHGGMNLLGKEDAWDNLIKEAGRLRAKRTGENAV